MECMQGVSIYDISQPYLIFSPATLYKYSINWKNSRQEKKQKFTPNVNRISIIESLDEMLERQELTEVTYWVDKERDNVSPITLAF